MVWLEDDDLVHLADRSYAVYRLARDKGPVLESWEVKAHGKPALLAVERAMQTLDVRFCVAHSPRLPARPPSPALLRCCWRRESYRSSPSLFAPPVRAI